MDHLIYLLLVFIMLSRLFIAALSSPAGKGQGWYLIVSIPDLCCLSYFNNILTLCLKLITSLKMNTNNRWLNLTLYSQAEGVPKSSLIFCFSIHFFILFIYLFTYLVTLVLFFMPFT